MVGGELGPLWTPGFAEPPKLATNHHPPYSHTRAQVNEVDRKRIAC